jgi:hypothetical protein
MPESSRPAADEIERLKETFEALSGAFITNVEHDIELARARADREALIREQIKVSVMKHARELFHHAYTLARRQSAEVSHES